MSRAEELRLRLGRARLYLCTDARRDLGDLADFLDAVCAGGVDIVQLRDKSLEAREELDALEIIREVCDRHGALVAVNDRADIARAVRADVLHLGQLDLPVLAARDMVGVDMLIGRSSHSEAESSAAADEPGVDYYAVGPCWPTPTKPGRHAPGLDLVRYVATDVASCDLALPWFAIGGVDLGNLDEVLDAGASRVVVVRALTQAGSLEAAHDAALAFATRLATRAATGGVAG